MKRLLTIILVLNGLLSYSQTVEEIVFTAGVSYSTLDWHYNTAGNGFNTDFDHLTGINANINLDFTGSKYFNLTSGIGYHEKGGNTTILINGYDVGWANN